MRPRLRVAVAIVALVGGCGGGEADLSAPAAGEPSVPAGEADQATRPQQDRSGCDPRVSGEFTRRFPAALKPSKAAVVACGSLPSGGPFELVAFQLEGNQCVATVYEQGAAGSSCGADRGADGIANVASSEDGPGVKPAELVGSASPETSSVAFRYSTAEKGDAEVQAVLGPVTGETQRRVGAERPYTLFITEVPPGAKNVIAEARDSEGDSIGTASFDSLLQPDSPPVPE